MDSDFNWFMTVTVINQLNSTRNTYFNDLEPSYNEDVPANYTSANVTFRVEFHNNEDARTVDTLDRIPYA